MVGLAFLVPTKTCKDGKRSLLFDSHDGLSFRVNYLVNIEPSPARRIMKKLTYQDLG